MRLCPIKKDSGPYRVSRDTSRGSEAYLIGKVGGLPGKELMSGKTYPTYKKISYQKSDVRTQVASGLGSGMKSG